MAFELVEQLEKDGFDLDPDNRLIQKVESIPPKKKMTLDDIIIDTGKFSEINISERQAYLSPWLKEDSINLISGWRGSGKTWLALSILDSVTRGTDFGPWKCLKSVPCLFLDGEMTVYDDLERIRDLKLNTNREMPFYFYSDAYANHFGIPRAHLANTKWRELMKGILSARNIKLWVIDNLASLASGLDENSKRDWDPVNQWLLELRFAGISTMMLHHLGKSGAQRGTSAREDNLDTSIILKHPSDYTPEDGARFIVHFAKARVSTKDLQSISDTEFKLIQDESSQASWQWGNVKREKKREILKAIDDGLDNKTICETLDISKGYVSRVRKEAIETGLLTKQGKLRHDGIVYVSES